MLSELKRKRDKQKKRTLRVRKHLKGTTERPRLCITKTNKNIYIQLIDDVQGKTLIGLSTQSKQLKLKKTKNSAKILGEKFAQAAKEKQVQSVVFDRGKSKFHGVVATFASAARDGGLQF